MHYVRKTISWRMHVLQLRTQAYFKALDKLFYFHCVDLDIIIIVIGSYAELAKAMQYISSNS